MATQLTIGNPPSSRFSKRSIGAVVGIGVALLVKLLPPFGGLDAIGQSALAMMSLAVVFWMTDVLNPGITALLTLGLLMVSGVPSSVALSGFATGAFWILVGVLSFGTAMERTRLARRIAYRILLIFRPTYAGISFAFMLIGFVLALCVPSMTVRTAIMVPIAFALVQAIKLPLPSRGAGLIVLGAFEMAVLPGCAVLTGSLYGPFIAGVFGTVGIPLTWFEYARAMTLPTVVWCAAIVAVNLLLMRPSAAVGMNEDVIRDEIRELGPMSRPERQTAICVAMAVTAWATQPWHGVPPEAVGLIALAALFATGVLVAADIGTGIPWGLALFAGGMLSLTSVMSTYKINAWLGGYIVPTVEPFIDQPFLLVVVLSVAVAAMRFLDTAGFITIAAFLVTLLTFAAGRGIPPLVLTAIVLLPIHIFWFNYQNFWVVMTEGISRKSAYTDRDRVTLATAFFGVTIATLWVSLGYWQIIGLL